MSDRITTDPQEVLDITQEDLPLLVLSDNVRSLFAWGIRLHEHGSYNHFIWMIKPGEFISQDALLHTVPAKDYLTGKHRLKFIRGNFTQIEKERIISTLNDNLNQSWFRRLYDPLQILGIAIGAKWLQIPGHSRICSDFAGMLKLVDSDYDLKHPSPTEVNEYTKSHQKKYSVYLRFIPD